MHEALIVGAGPAGLAASRELARRGVGHVVLERGDRVGHAWHHLYDGLVLHTGKHLSALPGLPFPRATPLFPTRRHFVDYLERYASGFRLPVRTGAECVSLTRDGDAWVAQLAGGGAVAARAVVVATGIISNPYRPALPGAGAFAGRLMHSVEYRRPAGFEGLRVLVVGAGNSAGEISVELAGAGARVTVAVRSGARVVPLTLAGVPIQYVAAGLCHLPLAAQRRLADLVAGLSAVVRGPAVLPRPPDTDCPDVPLIGFHLVDAVRQGRIRLAGGVAALTPAGARFADGAEEAFDAVILATGYRAAVGFLRGLVRVDDCGFAARRNRVFSADQPGLFLVGHNYDLRGGLRNIAIDARRVGRALADGAVRAARVTAPDAPARTSR